MQNIHGYALPCPTAGGTRCLSRCGGDRRPWPFAGPLPPAALDRLRCLHSYPALVSLVWLLILLFSGRTVPWAWMDLGWIVVRGAGGGYRLGKHMLSEVSGIHPSVVLDSMLYKCFEPFGSSHSHGLFIGERFEVLFCHLLCM